MGSSGPNQEDRLSATAVRHRASAGVFYLFSSGLVQLVVGFGGSLALARLLSPHAFGLVALGITVIALSQTVSDGGLAAALIRREEAPTHNELRSLMGLQLVITTSISAAAIAIALQYGEAGQIASVMILSLPLSAIQTAARVVLIRGLAFGKTSLADTTGMVAYYAWSIPAAALGAGAWSMATGTVVRALVITILIVAFSRLRLMPSLRRFRGLGPLIRFGIPFQLTWIAYATRLEFLNVGTAVFGSVSTLGQWSLADRIMQLPALVFRSVGQVAYPAMSRVLAEGEDPRPLLERGTRIAAIVATLSIAPFAAAAPTLVPHVFGAQWEDAGFVLPLTGFALLILPPIHVTGVGYLNARNRPTDPLRAIVVGSLVMLPVSLGLLPVLGIMGLGVGLIASSVVEGLVIDHYVRRDCSARLAAQVVRPALVGVTAGTTGVVVGALGPSALGWSLVAGCVGLGIAVVGLIAVCRSDLFRTIAVLWAAVGNATDGLRRGRTRSRGGDVRIPELDSADAIAADAALAASDARKSA
jgi:O-antigen/teichoic acid export membrane protein